MKDVLKETDILGAEMNEYIEFITGICRSSANNQYSILHNLLDKFINQMDCLRFYCGLKSVDCTSLCG